jgi:hypothetical protein
MTLNKAISQSPASKCSNTHSQISSLVLHQRDNEDEETRNDGRLAPKSLQRAVFACPWYLEIRDTKSAKSSR